MYDELREHERKEDLDRATDAFIYAWTDGDFNSAAYYAVELSKEHIDYLVHALAAIF